MLRATQLALFSAASSLVGGALGAEGGGTGVYVPTPAPTPAPVLAVGVGSRVGHASLQRPFSTCYPPTAPSSMSLADYDGQLNGGEFKILVIATFYTGCAPGRFIAPGFAELSAAMQTQYGGDVIFLSSVKGSSSCATWASQKFNLDGNTATADPGIPIAISDPDSALHYTFFSGNPQIAVLDKGMVVRQIEEHDGNTDANGNLLSFIGGGLPALVAQLIAEPDPVSAPATPPAPLPEIFEVGGTHGWINGIESITGHPYDPIVATVGDVLSFTYGANHDVRLMASDTCAGRTTATELAGPAGSPYMHHLTAAGTFVFACSIRDHCTEGQKITVQVSPRSGAAISLFDTLAAQPARFSTFTSAVTAAGLVDALTNDGPYTVFVPSDEAFAAMPMAEYDIFFNRTLSQLADSLEYHMLPGSLRESDLRNRSELSTESPMGVGITVAQDSSGSVLLNGVSAVVEADIQASNGVIHVVDAVLQPPVAAEPVCAPLFGEQNSVHVFAGGMNLNFPSDLQFHPLRPNELWIANKHSDDVTILDITTGNTLNRQDRAPYHYMEEIVSLAFDERGYFATCQESENDYNGMMVRNWFMGPSLFHSQESDLITQLGDRCSAADVADPDTTCFFTHYDMLHESPLCMGIAHDPETITPFGNVYWVFDGLNGTLIRYDFQEPHGPGSLDHSRASVRRYDDIELTRVPGIPGHVMMDPAARVLYVSDTGGNRVLRVNPDSGTFIRNAKSEFPIYSSTAETFEYTVWGCTEWEVFAEGIDRPSGLHVDGNIVYVSEWGTSTIIAFDKTTGARISTVATGASGMMGFAQGPSGPGGETQLWFSDGPADTISYIRVNQPCSVADARPADAHTVVWPARECQQVAENTTFVDHVAHTAGYMNITAFLDIADYADAQAHHCGGGDITQGAAMAGMPTSGRINNDALLMEGYMCHVCLPTPCLNGGVCAHPRFWAFTCDCAGTGHRGDICQTPLPPCSGDVNGNGVVEVGDVLEVLTYFGLSGESYFTVLNRTGTAADVNGDNRVAVVDVLTVLSMFGRVC